MAKKKQIDKPCGCGAEKKHEAPCCGPSSPRLIRYRPVRFIGETRVPSGKVKTVPVQWDNQDWLGAVLLKLGFFRMSYAVPPGLYGVGSPTRKSPVLVSCNYKLSFDVLRRSLAGLDAWILVVDTKGVNVWCSAGKGTFCAEEISRMVKKTNLEKIVGHKNLVLPQLSAPGVAAYKLFKLCGFRGVFGPVEASDIPAFVKNSMKVPASDRLVRFGVRERMSVAWYDLSIAFQWLFVISAALVVIGLFFNDMSLTASLIMLTPLILSLLTGVVAGGILVPLSLPLLPTRTFSIKGAVAGALLGAFVFLPLVILLNFPGVKSGGYILIAAAVSAYLGLNFTGSTTFTSLSGVKKEVRVALPSILGSLAAGLILIFL